MQRLAAVLLLLLGIGCTPALNNTPSGDDDDATGDDDDATADDDDATADDDDATGDDDDDGTMGCDDVGLQLISMSSSAGLDFEGSWYDGELTVIDDTVTVTDAAGVQTTFTTSVTEFMQGLDGPGRVFWYTPGNTAWGSDALLGVESWGDNWVRLALGNIALPPPTLQDAWAFDVELALEGCGELGRGECGDYQPLPITATMPDGGGGMVSAFVLPGETVQPTNMVGFQHLGGIVYQEVLCPDTPSAEFAWIYGQLLEDVVIGLQ